MDSDLWREGRKDSSWAMQYAKKNGCDMTKPTLYKAMTDHGLGIKIGGNYKVDKYRFEQHIK